MRAWEVGNCASHHSLLRRVRTIVPRPAGETTRGRAHEILSAPRGTECGCWCVHGSARASFPVPSLLAGEESLDLSGVLSLPLLCRLGEIVDGLRRGTLCDCALCSLFVTVTSAAEVSPLAGAFVMSRSPCHEKRKKHKNTIYRC